MKYSSWWVTICVVAACGDDPPVYTLATHQGEASAIEEQKRQAEIERDQKFRREHVNRLRSSVREAIEASRRRVAEERRTRRRYEGNAHGIDLEVPVGRYSGVGITNVVVDEAVDQNGSIYYGAAAPITAPPGRSSGIRGWAFEPVKTAARSYHVFVAAPYEELVQPPTPELSTRYITTCDITFRYTLVGEHQSVEFRAPDEQTRVQCRFSVEDIRGAGTPDVIQGPMACIYNMQQRCAPPATGEYVADDGSRLRIANDQLVVDDLDGTSTVYGRPLDKRDIDWWRQYHARVAQGMAVSAETTPIADRFWLPLHATDRNGNRTAFEYAGPYGSLTKVTDPRGRETHYERGPDGGLTAIGIPAPGGGTNRYALEWIARDWLPPSQVRADREVYTTLGALGLPDGRRYAFDYTPSGHLSEVVYPDGSARRYRYVEDPIPDPWVSLTHYVEELVLSEEEVFPLGLDGSSYTIRHERYRLQDGTGPYYDWEHTIDPDGTVHRTKYERPSGAGPCQAVHRGALVEEVWSSGSGSQPVGGNGEWTGQGLLSRTTYRYGGTYRQDGIQCSSFADERVTGTDREIDGVAWSESFEHQQHPRLSGRVIARNVVRHVTTDPSGPAREVDRTFVTDPAYLDRHLLSLVSEETTTGATGYGGVDVLARTAFGYDSEELVASGVEGVVDVGPIRGNVTRITRWADPAAWGGPVSTRTRYQDDGRVSMEWSARAVEAGDAPSAARRHEYDPGRCGPGKTTTWSRVTFPAPGNGATHVTEAISDCNSGLVLRARAADGGVTCSQYDRQGRILEIAGPDDRLSSIDAVRAAECPVVAGGLGADGAGPTQWYEYLDQDRVGRARTVVHTKNGTATGLRSTTWSDGMGREIQNCIEVDPAGLVAELREVLSTPVACVWRAYDHDDRLLEASVSVFQPDMPERVVEWPGAARRERRTYDALGRITSTTTAGGRHTTTRHGGDGGRLISDVTPPNGAGHARRTARSVFGWVTSVAQVWDGCEGGWCTTAFGVDGLGRVTSVREPTGEGVGGAVTTTRYDGLGRVLEMEDPDRGTIRSTYDANGNKVLEIDGNGDAIVYAYDGLDRLIRKTYPSSHPAPERVVEWHWDGRSDAPPGIDAQVNGDHQIGRLTGEGNGLYSVWRRHDARGAILATFTRLDDGTGGAREVWATRSTFGYPAGSVPGPGTVQLTSEVPHACRGGDVIDCSTPAEIVTSRYDVSGLEIGLDTVRPDGATIRIVDRIVRNAGGDIVEQRFGNGVVSKRQYTGDRELGSIVARGPAGVVQSLRYEYDAHGNVVDVADFATCDPSADDCARQDASGRFEYDTLDRLVDMSTASAHRRWTYDAASNLVTIAQSGLGAFRREMQHGGAGQPAHAVTRVTEGEQAYDLAYDRAGSLRQRGDLQIDWNADHMPIRARRGERVLYTKHFLGERLWKRASADVVVYHLRGLRLERRGEQTRSVISYGTYASTDPDAGGALRWSHSDLLNSNAVVTDEDGKVVYRESFWPYGESRFRTGVHEPVRRFSGKEHEDDTGYVDFGARLYDPEIGRWVSADDDERDGFNRYTYVRNNPVTLYDPDGHQSKKKDKDKSPRTDQQQQQQRQQSGQQQTGTGQVRVATSVTLTLAMPGPVAGKVNATFTCGNVVNGQQACTPNKPVVVPGGKTFVGVVIRYDHTGPQSMQLVPRPEPAAPPPSYNGVEIGATYSFVAVAGATMFDGPDAGKGAFKIGLQAVPGASIQGKPVGDIKSGLSLSVQWGVWERDVFKLSGEGVTFWQPPGWSFQVPVDEATRRPRAPTSWRDWLPNAYLTLTIGPDWGTTKPMVQGYGCAKAGVGCR